MSEDLRNEYETINIFDIQNYYNENIVLHAIDRYGEWCDGFDEIHYSKGKAMIFPTDKPLNQINAVSKEYIILPIH